MCDVEVEGRVDDCFHIFRLVGEDAIDQLRILILHYAGQVHSRIHLAHWLGWVVLVQLKKLVDEVKLLALNGEQFEDFLRIVKTHCAVELGVAGE